MKRKQQFLKAIHILAPDDLLILQIAERIPEERLPAYPGGAALEFVVAMQKLRAAAKEDSFPPAASQCACHPPAKATPDQLSISHALRVKSAEYWLKLGEPACAMMELERLPEKTRKHPSALKVQVAALKAAREMTEVTVQE